MSKDYTINPRYASFESKYRRFSNDYIDDYLKRSFDYNAANIVDDSSYQPSSEVVKQATINKLITGNQSSKGVYDYQSGDSIPNNLTRSDLPITRQKGVDLAEISQEIIIQKETIILFL